MINLIALLLYFSLFLVSLKKTEYALFLYIFFLPIRSLIQIPFIQLNSIFSFILLFHFIRNGYFQRRFLKSDPFIKALVFFSGVVLFSTLVTLLRSQYLLNIFENHAAISLKAIFRLIIERIVTVIVISIIIQKSMQFRRARKIAFYSIITSGFVLILSAYFAPQLASMGLNVREEFMGTYELNELGRTVGLFNAGDSNAFAALLNIIICFIIMYNNIRNKQTSIFWLLLLLFYAFAIQFSGSRTGFYSLLFNLALFFLMLMKKRDIIQYNKSIFLIFGSILLVQVVIMNYSVFRLPFERIATLGAIDGVLEGGGRYIIWMSYINFMLEDFTRFIFGSDRIYYVYGFRGIIGMHNFFIHIFFYNGFFNLLLILYSIIILFMRSIRAKLFHIFLPISLILFAAIMTISAYQFILYYIIILALFYYDQRSYNENNVNC